MKSDVFGKIKDFLLSRGFSTFEYPRGCFDIAARREDMLLLKVLTNVDSFQKKQAEDLKVLSQFLDSSCFVLGRRTRRDKLRDSVIYERFGVPAMTPETFTSVIRGEYPERFRTRGGTFRRLNTDELRRKRRKNKMTQTELAEQLGISQKRVSEYESGKERATLDMVEALEEIFGDCVSRDIDPFDIEIRAEEMKRAGSQISRRLMEIGFNTRSVARAPPRLLARDGKTILTRIVKKDEKADLGHLAEFSRLSETEVFVITDGDRKVETVPAIGRERLEEVGSSGELMKIIEERRSS